MVLAPTEKALKWSSDRDPCPRGVDGWRFASSCLPVNADDKGDVLGSWYGIIDDGSKSYILLVPGVTDAGVPLYRAMLSRELLSDGMRLYEHQVPPWWTETMITSAEWHQSFLDRLRAVSDSIWPGVLTDSQGCDQGLM